MARMMLNTDNNQSMPQEPDHQATAAPQPDSQPAPQPVMQQPASEEDRYAHMFASWDLLPPQVLIRRVTRK